MLLAVDLVVLLSTFVVLLWWELWWLYAVSVSFYTVTAVNIGIGSWVVWQTSREVRRINQRVARQQVEFDRELARLTRKHSDGPTSR